MRQSRESINISNMLQKEKSWQLFKRCYILRVVAEKVFQ